MNTQFRDATGVELMDEPDSVLESMSRGEMGVTATTADLARQELERRRGPDVAGDVDTTHECPAPGCTVSVDVDTFACRSHWFSIPKPLRDALWRAWRNGDLDHHARVRAECVAFLEGRRP